MCLGGCLHKRLVFELVDWVKKIIFTSVSGHHPIILRPLWAWVEPKAEEGWICSLSLNWDIHLLLPSYISAPGFRVFGLRQGLTPSALWLSGLWTQTYTIVSSGSQDSGIGLNNTTGFPGSPTCRWQIMGLLASIITWVNYYNKSLIHIYMHVLLVLFLWWTLNNTEYKGFSPKRGVGLYNIKCMWRANTSSWGHEYGQLPCTAPTQAQLSVYLAPREHSQGRETTEVSWAQMWLAKWTELSQGNWLEPENPEGGRIPSLTAVNRF